jgi:hypothetical protein
LSRRVTILEALVAVVAVVWRSTITTALSFSHPVSPKVEAVDIRNTYNTSKMRQGYNAYL